MANIDRIDTAQTAGASRPRPTPPGPAPALRRDAAQRAEPPADRIELSGAARASAEQAAAARAERLEQIKGEIASDPNAYIDRVFDERLDDIVDAIAQDLFGDA